MIVRKAISPRTGRVPAMGAAFAVLAMALTPAPEARATELQTEETDPNGPPPMPPPMPPPGEPGSATPPPAAGSTEAQLATADVEDSGIGLKLFYLQPEVGLGWASIGKSIPAPQIATQDYTQFRSGSGLALGLGAGAEFITFQLGGRLRTLSTPNWNLWNAGAEVMYQPGSGRFWPRLGLTVGYAWLARFSDDVCAGPCSALDIGGLSVGARGGVQYFVTSNIEIGADATFDYLSLRRSAIANNPVYGTESSGNGVMMALMGHIGVHLP
jgi:hypothetical protein